jgi:cytochrome c556
MPNIEVILNYFFGTTTVISGYIAYKSRNSDIKKNEATALESIQSVYDKFTEQTEKRFLEMQKVIDNQTTEIRSLKDALVNYQKKCQMCSSNK